MAAEMTAHTGQFIYFLGKVAFANIVTDPDPRSGSSAFSAFLPSDPDPG